MARPVLPTDRAHDRKFRGVAVRTDDALELDLDRLALALSEPGRRMTRTEAARRALFAGLAVLRSRGADAA
jgi:hypothetical protein